MKEQMAVMNRWLDEAIAEGGDAAKEYLHTVARIIGSQVARITAPDEMPQILTGTIEEMGKGVTAGMLMKHGHAGVMDVRMFNLTRGNR